jgi:hypothetical protein
MGGFALVPSILRAPAGDVKILGFPLPDNFPEDRYPTAEYADQIRSYIEEAKVPVEKGLPLKALSQVSKILTEDDGSHRYEWRTSDIERALTSSKAIFSEQYIPVDAEVTVIATYSAEKGGLINDLSQGGMEVMPGGIDQALARVRARRIWQLVFSLVMLGVGTFGTAAVLNLRETRDPDLVFAREGRLVTAIRANDLVGAEKELAKGVSLESTVVDQATRDGLSDEMFELLLKYRLELGRYDQYGSTRLQAAVRRGEISRVKQLLKAGANVNQRQRDWSTTALEIALDDGNKELAKLLVDAGGEATFVSGKNGTQLPEDGGEPFQAVLRYLRAHRELDVSALRNFTDAWPEDFFESAGRGLYRETRVQEPKFRVGFANDSAATLFVSGASGVNGELWVFTLVRRNGEWRVRRESLRD